jgi:hypothetical protein
MFEHMPLRGSATIFTALDGFVNAISFMLGTKENIAIMVQWISIIDTSKITQGF